LVRRLDQLPQATCARNEVVMRLTEAENLFASGIGYIDTHLVVLVG
jgi:hypothetical protein